MPEAPRWRIKVATLFLKLKETPAEALTGSAIACALRVLQAEDAPLDALERILSDAVACLEELSEEHQAEWRRAMQYLLLLIHHRRASDERDDLFAVVTDSVRHSHREEVGQMAVTSAQALISQGREQGRAEGQSQGRVEMLLELLEVRFGPLPPQVPAAVQALPAQQLKELLRRALTAASLDDLQLEA